MAFAKAWRRRAREASAAQAVLLSCHYDVLDWLQPDWVWDTATGRFAGRCFGDARPSPSTSPRPTGGTGRYSIRITI